MALFLNALSYSDAIKTPVLTPVFLFITIGFAVVSNILMEWYF